MTHKTKIVSLVTTLALVISVSGYISFCNLNNGEAEAEAKKTFLKNQIARIPNNLKQNIQSSDVSKTSSSIVATSVSATNPNSTIKTSSSKKLEPNSSVTNSNPTQTNSSKIEPSQPINLPISVDPIKTIAQSNIGICANQAKINLTPSTSPFLTQLSKYQNICNSKVASKMMIFTQIPSSKSTIQPKVDELISVLKEFDQYGITPVVVAEPIDNQNMLSFVDFAAGKYNPTLDTFFQSLKNSGLTDKQMGIWVPFPEPNIPAWNSVGSKPSDIPAIINNYSSSLKKYFPNTHVSVLFNSTSFDPSDKAYSKPKTTILDEYITGINAGAVDSFGMQGFPWAPPKSLGGESSYNANNFLRPDIAMRSAKILGTNQIWFNTGTFATKYSLPSAKVTVSPSERMAINNQKISVFEQVKNAGYKVWVNEFVEDKSATAEETNFSYLNSKEDSEIFKDYVNKLSAKAIDLSLFDSK
jgi:hypothetical protein